MPIKNKRQLRVTTLALGLGFVLASSANLRAQLSPDIQADRLLVQAEREIGDDDMVAAIATLEQILALSQHHQFDLPSQFWFRFASAALAAENYDRAIEGVTQYLQMEGREGEHYREALELLDSAELAQRRTRERNEWRKSVLPSIQSSLQKIESAGKFATKSDVETVIEPGVPREIGTFLGMSFYRDCTLRIMANVRSKEVRFDYTLEGKLVGPWNYIIEIKYDVDGVLQDPNLEIRKERRPIEWPSSFSEEPIWGGIVVDFGENIVEREVWIDDEYLSSGKLSSIPLPIWKDVPNVELLNEAVDAFESIAVYCATR